MDDVWIEVLDPLHKTGQHLDLPKELSQSRHFEQLQIYRTAQQVQIWFCFTFGKEKENACVLVLSNTTS
jgi:hypothetical protein